MAPQPRSLIVARHISLTRELRMDHDESDDRYARLLQRHPVGDLSAGELETWVAKVLTSVGEQEGISELVVQNHERVVGVDGT